MPRLLLAFLSFAAPAAAQTTITSVPYTITASGKYVLGTNLVTVIAAQAAITINAPNVILDLNGFFVSGPGNSTTSDQNVIGVANVSNVTIRNGTVANNGYGIFFNSGANGINHLVEGVNVTRCYLTSVLFEGDSPGSILRFCTFSQVGGSTATASPDASAIKTNAAVRIENNSIATVTATGAGTSFGIQASAASVVPGSFVIGNTIADCGISIFGGKYLNNVTLNCTTPCTGGTNAGGNN